MRCIRKKLIADFGAAAPPNGDKSPHHRVEVAPRVVSIPETGRFDLLIVYISLKFSRLPSRPMKKPKP
jgi:hypothetical protein